MKSKFFVVTHCNGTNNINGSNKNIVAQDLKVDVLESYIKIKEETTLKMILLGQYQK